MVYDMNLIFKIVAFVFVILELNSIKLIHAKSKVEKCKLCTELVENFIKGLKKTSKGNFGGGNTDWEDRKLGNYLFSETRFEEIVENTCKETECHQLLESHEDDLFDWFKNKQKRIEAELFNEFCINSAKQCCPKEKYGPSCSLCPRQFDAVCSGNGKCDGDGTRAGKGKCSCSSGYSGDLCDKCASGYYEEAKNETFVKCTECHRSCSKCTGPSQSECQTCKSGWKMNEESKICDDVNECLVNGNVCKENEYCQNSEGSYACYECDRSCKSCTDKGLDKCNECNDGYRRNEASNQCQDIDECIETPNLCEGILKCVNTPGGYECRAEEMVDEQEETAASESNDTNEEKTTKPNRHAGEDNKLEDDASDYAEDNNENADKSHEKLLNPIGLKSEL